MKRRFILYRRKLGGTFYVEDTETRKQESLGTKNRAEATSLLNARNESVRQPQLNLQIAKAYLAGTDSGIATRTWQQALDAIVETKSGSTQDRWRRAAKETALDGIRNRVILETQAEHLLACLKAGTVSTNVHLRKLHNFCISMNWLPWPLIPKRLWPEVRFKDKRAITNEEHQLIIEREKNPERNAFYELCWHLGGSQTDIANLKAEDIDWPNQTIAYARQKTGSLAMIHFGPDIEAILRRLNATGYLFPYANAQDMYNKGVLPMNENLHILLSEETSIHMYPTFARKWASYMNGGEDGVKHTIIESWNFASRDIHSITNVVPAGMRSS